MRSPAIAPSGVAWPLLAGASPSLVAALGHLCGIWDVATQAPIIEPQSDVQYLSDVAFSPDRQLLLGSEDLAGAFVRYATEPRWQAQACGIADRSFTDTEWRQVFGSTPYQKVCPSQTARP